MSEQKRVTEDLLRRGYIFQQGFGWEPDEDDMLYLVEKEQDDEDGIAVTDNGAIVGQHPGFRSLAEHLAVWMPHRNVFITDVPVTADVRLAGAVNKFYVATLDDGDALVNWEGRYTARSQRLLTTMVARTRARVRMPGSSSAGQILQQRYDEAKRRPGGIPPKRSRR